MKLLQMTAAMVGGSYIVAMAVLTFVTRLQYPQFTETQVFLAHWAYYLGTLPAIFLLALGPWNEDRKR